VIAALAFGPPRAVAGRAVRSVTFAPRSSLPSSAACLVANGVREALSRLLATDIDVDLTEPAMPGAEHRRLLVAGATVVRVRGRLSDGFIVVRPADARRLVSLAFGEDEPDGSDTLSEIERATLDRIVYALVPLCNTLCGTLGPAARETADRAASDLATYFEVRTTGRTRIALGFGLGSDPAEPLSERITLDDLADVELEGVVEFARGSLSVPAFSRLAAGATVELETPVAAPGVLRFGEVAFARGICGASDGRSVVRFTGDLDRGSA
jgi:flagellar motor switch/type III secretory pathway protein FliN